MLSATIGKCGQRTSHSLITYAYADSINTTFRRTLYRTPALKLKLFRDSKVPKGHRKEQSWYVQIQQSTCWVQFYGTKVHPNMIQWGIKLFKFHFSIFGREFRFWSTSTFVMNGFHQVINFDSHSREFGIEIQLIFSTNWTNSVVIFIAEILSNSKLERKISNGYF